MARYIDEDKLVKKSFRIEGHIDLPSGKAQNFSAIDVAEILNFPPADVAPVVHGHIIWRERHSGGFRERKCLSDCGNSVFTPLCNQISKIDDRCIESRPYCSVCGKLLGDFSSYCGNCGAKMDGDTNAEMP